jgi:iron complex transport system substrate-binding protein
MKMYRCIAILLAFVAAAGMAATRADADPVRIRDASGHVVDIRDASRIVAIGGAVTEILYALGAERQIVAIDTSSLFPVQALKDKPNVGYMRQLSAEGVLALSPSLVLAAEGSGPPAVIDILQAAGVAFVQVPDRFTGEGIVEKIRLIGHAIGRGAEAECLVESVQADLDALASSRGKIDKPARVLFVLSFANGRAMVAGRSTAADGIIRLADAENAITEFDGYKAVSDEAILAARPDVILAIERPGFRLGAADIFNRPAFSLTPAARQKAFISMDGLYLLGFGPRTVRAASDLRRAIYPDRVVSPGKTVPAEARRCD